LSSLISHYLSKILNQNTLEILTEIFAIPVRYSIVYSHVYVFPQAYSQEKFLEPNVGLIFKLVNMGIRGLATFISNNSSQYLQSHRLHDCTIIVDGNNLASQLYIYFSKSNAAYGGDYDRYYKCIKHFFDCLAECKVQALVVFDGGYEKRKLPTFWERLKGKIYACNKVNPNNQTRKNVFPLLMRETFR
jgi:hypothetical protein